MTRYINVAIWRIRLDCVTELYQKLSIDNKIEITDRLRTGYKSDSASSIVFEAYYYRKDCDELTWHLLLTNDTRRYLLKLLIPYVRIHDRYLSGVS